MEQKNKQLMIFLAGELRCKVNLLATIKMNSFDFYAADGGYLLADQLGIVPQKVFGDFDSAPRPPRKDILVFPSEKDQTDSELALDLAKEDGYRNIWMIAPFGGRLDHTIANLCLLEKANIQKLDLKLYDGENSAFLLDEGEHTLDSHYQYISFFPWKEQAVISLEGFKYPLDHYTLVRETPIAVSNEPASFAPTVRIHRGKLLCICVEKHEEEL
ncbi:MAG: thiamine diphosphokinase [Clostridia bacterium]|nr:thiamine diphosphokinase [Clostridia bacterium]